MINKTDYLSWSTYNNKKLWGLVIKFDSLLDQLAVGEYYPVSCKCSKNKLFEINIFLRINPDNDIKDNCIIRDRNNVIAIDPEDIEKLANCFEIDSIDKESGEILLNRDIKINNDIITVVYKNE